MTVMVAGVNTRNVSLESLEPLRIGEDYLPKVLDDLAGRDNIGEVVVLSTCMRTEIYAVAERYHGALAGIAESLSAYSGRPASEVAEQLYSYHDADAVRHLFQVAAGLDSAVVGEGEVLGQVGRAWHQARNQDSCGPELSGLFRHAIEVGKRARHETAIAKGTTSVSQAAVSMALKNLSHREGDVRALVLGAGVMGRGISKLLAVSPAVSNVTVVNRTWEAALEVADSIGGTAVRFDELPSALSEVDLLLSCTGANEIVVQSEDIESVMARRADRGLVVIDAAVPRDVDSSIGAIPGVTLFDMEDLQSFAESGLSARQGEIAAVESIIEQECERYLTVATAREVAPLVKSLREKGEAIRLAEMQRLGIAAADDEQKQKIDVLTKAIMAKLLHDPTVRLKDAAGTPRGERLAEALRALFDLEA